MKNTIYLLLGTNLGKREINLSMARGHIGNKVGTILHSSSIYETAAWGKEDQPDFLNQVVRLETHLDVHTLMETLEWIETTLGRQRKVKWGERIIDLDILFFENEIVDEPNLTVPHAGIPHRRFTLVPLQEIAAQFIHPALNKTVDQLLEECPDMLEVRPYLKDS